MRKFLIFFIIGFLSFAPFTKSVDAKDSSIYKIKQGDTLWDIAQEHRIHVDDLIEWNGLHSTLIFPEQTLTILPKAKTYVVEKGDTLSEIAEAHQVSLNDLRAWNKLNNHLIFPGDELLLNEQSAQKTSIGKQPVQKQKLNQEKHVQQKVSPTKPAQNKQAKAQTKKTPKEPVSGKELTVTATAYTAYCKGCSGTTYTGINLRANPNQKVIAVDPNIIPLGSRVWVEGYGEAIAGDIGGAIKGHTIDVFLQHQQDALNWGRKQVKVKVLE